jgi:hypothetical protein
MEVFDAIRRPGACQQGSERIRWSGELCVDKHLHFTKFTWVNDVVSMQDDINAN